jgi:hypothetical protein
VTERLADADRFLALVQDRDVTARLNVPATRLEGYLFPDTYRLTRAREIVRVMVSRFQQAIPADFEEQVARLKMDTHQIVTLASLIEKEVVGLERPLISAVFHNRLRQRAVAIDPTAVYMVPRTQRRITASDLQRKTLTQHLSSTWSSARADRQPGSRIDPGGPAPRARQLPLLRREERRIASVFAGPGAASPGRSPVSGRRESVARGRQGRSEAGVAAEDPQRPCAADRRLVTNRRSE